MIFKMAEKTAQINNYEISRADKLMYPDSHITKQDVADYFNRVSEYILPHLKDRPLSLKRFPDGIEGESFYQKNAPKNIPDEAEIAEIDNKRGGSTRYLVCNNTTTLIYLADLACLTPHIWLSLKDRPDYPDRVIFDLDPSDGDNDFRKVVEGARLIRALLNKIGLKPFVMTTGSRGLHVVVALKRNEDYDYVRDFARQVADKLADLYPDLLTTELRKSERGGRLFLDTARNSFGQTGVMPYAPRAIEEAPVATPLEWDELDQADLGPQKYKIKNIFRRLSQKDDPFKNFYRHAYSLKGKTELLGKIKAQSDIAN